MKKEIKITDKEKAAVIELKKVISTSDDEDIKGIILLIDKSI